MTLLPHLLHETGPQPQHCIIWLHGLGANGYDFEPMVNELKLPLAIRYIFPHAPEMPVTINGGYIMPAWYDIKGARIEDKQDEMGIRRSQAAIEALIQQQINQGIAPENIFLAGFSQGCAMVLHTALRLPFRLAGVIGLSGYLPLVQLAATEKTTASFSTPLLIAHGTQDTVVPMALGSESCDLLVNWGYHVDWQQYAMPHSVCPAEIRAIERWLCQQLNATT